MESKSYHIEIHDGAKELPTNYYNNQYDVLTTRYIVTVKRLPPNTQICTWDTELNLFESVEDICEIPNTVGPEDCYRGAIKPLVEIEEE
jgi:hypothetical protein